MGALLSFIDAHGSKTGAAQALSITFGPLLGDVHGTVGRFEELLESADAGRQGLPLPALQVLSTYLGVSLAELRTVVSLVEHGGDLPLHLHPIPSPIQPSVRVANLAKTQPITPTAKVSRRAWTISATGSDAYVRAFDIYSGVMSDSLLVTGCTTAADFILGASKFWTVAGGGLHRLYAFNPYSSPVSLVLETSYEYPNTVALAFEDELSQLWVVQSSQVNRVDQATGLPIETGSLIANGPNDLFEATAFGKKVFVVGTTAATPAEGHLFVVDADDIASYVVSKPDITDQVVAVAVESASVVWVLVASSGVVWKVEFDGADWIASAVTVTGGDIGQPNTIEFFDSALWISGLSLGGNTMLTKLSTAGVVLGQAVYSPLTTDLGRLGFDGVFPWAPETSTLRRIHPTLATLDTVLSVPSPSVFESFLACLVV